MFYPVSCRTDRSGDIGPHLGSLLLGTLATATSEPSAAIIGGLACALVVTVISIRQKGLIAYDARHPGAEDGIRTGLQSGGAG